MTDALQWIVDLLFVDIARTAVGLLVLISLIEFLLRFRAWLT